jgi:rhamnulose-1-phosphate aldolase
VSVRLPDGLELPTGESDTAVALPLEEPLAAIGGRAFLTSGTGSRMRDVAVDPAARLAVVRVDAGGRGYRVLASHGAATPAPTSEFPSHLMIHDHLVSEGREETAVVHSHPTELIALTHVRPSADAEKLSRYLWCVHPEVRVFVPEGIGLVPYTLPGSFDLARATVAALRGRRVVLWAMHGAVAVARDPDEAFDLLDIANKAARIWLKVRAVRIEPRGLRKRDLEDLDAAFGDPGSR